MKTTLEQQVKAINSARRVVLAEKTKVALNDAASTISALNLISPDKVLIASELISECTKMLAVWHYPMEGDDDITPYMAKVFKILKRLPK